MKTLRIVFAADNKGNIRGKPLNAAGKVHSDIKKRIYFSYTEMCHVSAYCAKIK